MDKSTVLFLCVGNSCRSQMAEAIVNARLDDRWQAFSAGSRPVGDVNPLALQVLAEIGINHHGRAKSVEEFRHQVFNKIVILCSQMDEECPIWLGSGTVIHRPFPDPTKLIGSAEKRLQEFRRLRDEMATVIPALLISD